ncbi:PAS domain S-box protein [Arcticibacter tournemirensis]
MDSPDITEANRLKTLRNYNILDTASESQFDSITRLISYICRTPIAFISFVDEDRQWIKSETGLNIKETSRSSAFCNYTIQNDTLLEVSDLTKDNRFSGSPYVMDDPHYRFYAGSPITTAEGYHIGTLCVMDYKPRHLNAHERDALKILSNEVMSHLEVRKKNTELQQMLNQARQFQDLFNNSNEIHCITDSEGKIEFINTSVQLLIGYSVDEMLGKTIWDFSVPGERERVMPEVFRAISLGKTHFQVETRVITKGGPIRWFEWSDVIMNGRWLVNGRDITTRKEAELKIQNLSIAVEKSPAGVVIRNAKNEVSWMNEAAEKIIGYKVEELKGRIFGDLLIGEKTDLSVLKSAKQALVERKPYEIEIVVYKKDGTPIWVFISNSPLFNPDGHLESQIGIIVDITLRKHAEQQLIKTRQDAIDLSKSKEQFLSVMSHEMRTPLNAVIGLTRILKEEDPLERQKENLNILEFSAQNLLSLINDVLDFTKIETGNMTLDPAPLEIYKLVSQTIESLRFKSCDKDLRIDYYIDPRIPKVITGDSTRLYQIFMNLLGNAIKFTECGSVMLKLFLEAEDEDSVSIRFEVHDTGIGIKDDKLKAIFDAYTQAERDTSKKYGGTGLGLAITKKLIELHDSTIEVQSTHGEGTIFSFVIRYLRADKNTVPVETNINLDAPIDGRILVVDDNAMNRLLAGKVLGKWLTEIDYAENGQEAVEKVKDNDYDLVLMDIHMPVMNGLEAVKTIRELGGDKFVKLPIIALTASVQRSEEGRFLQAGMNDFVLKPFEPKDLYRKIRAHIL